MLGQHLSVNKLAKRFSEIFTSHIALPNTFNIINSNQLMSELLELSYGPHVKLASFDIANMYLNIPTSRLPNIINLMYTQLDVNKKLAREILKMTRLLLKQNYFQFRQNIYIQKEGLAMGAPTA